MEGREKPELPRQNPRHQGTQRQHLMQLPPLGVHWTPGHPAFPVAPSLQQMTGKAMLLTSLGRVEGICDGESKPEFPFLPLPGPLCPLPPTHTPQTWGWGRRLEIPEVPNSTERLSAL